jgi:hypothetical protein
VCGMGPLSTAEGRTRRRLCGPIRRVDIGFGQDDGDVSIGGPESAVAFHARQRAASALRVLGETRADQPTADVARRTIGSARSRESLLDSVLSTALHPGDRRPFTR